MRAIALISLPLISLLLAFLALAVWWLESRFDAGVAITVIGAILGVVALGIGYVLAMFSNRQALQAASNMHQAQSQAETARARALTESVRWARQSDGIMQRDVLRLSEQRANLLMDTRQQAEMSPDEWDEYTPGDEGVYTAPQGWGTRPQQAARVVYLE
jgi:hypothetical protein